MPLAYWQAFLSVHFPREFYLKAPASWAWWPSSGQARKAGVEILGARHQLEPQRPVCLKADLLGLGARTL